MNQTNFEIIELDKNYSTMRRLIKADPQEIAGLVKQSKKTEDKFETVLTYLKVSFVNVLYTR